MNKKLIRIIIAAVLLVAAWLITRSSNLAMWQQLLLFVVPYLVVGYDVLAEAWEGIMDRDPFNEDFLMAIATIGALCIGFLPGAESQFPEAVFVMLFFQVGEVFEDYAEDNSRKSISSLMDIRPDKANKLVVRSEELGVDRNEKLEVRSEELGVDRNSSLIVVSPSEVAVGDTILIKPGEKVPLDGVVTDGSSSLNTVALTGESVPRDVKPGDEIISGCVNLSGVLRVRVTKTFGESTASKIISLVENAGENKSKSETFISKFAHVYTPIVVFAAIALAIIPPVLFGGAFATWAYRALTFLVVSCPCALVISVPLTFFGGIGGASRKGILIKGGNYMDTLARLSTVVFDKTGTLTKGVFAVDAIHPDKLSPQELLHLAAHVERFSTHPIAAALRKAYPDEATDKCKVGNVKELSGHGVQAEVNGKQVTVGNEKMMETLGIKLKECAECRNHVGTVIHVAVDGEYAGHVVIADQIKDDSRDAIAELKRLGVERTVMLTGDQEAIAHQVATTLKIDEYHASLLPADKVSRVEDLIRKKPNGTALGFVGDGINDAPVLARADVGIAMGALGSDAAIEAADVVLMDDHPSKIATAISIARRTIRIAKENSWFAISVKVLILLLAALGVFGGYAMAIAVFGDVGVMILAVLNATRALSLPQPLR